MELKVNETQLPQPITFNYEELKTAIAEKAQLYASVVYTDETIKEAKADKANLNKLKKTLNDERIRREKEYMKPFNAFKDQVNEIIAIIDKPVKVIDEQIKDYQERLKSEKANEIMIEINEGGYSFPTELDIDMIWNPKWLNASFSMKQVKAELSQKADEINKDLATIDKLEKYNFEAREQYLATLNLRAALETANRLAEIERKKAEYEAERQKRAIASTAAAEPSKEHETIKITADSKMVDVSGSEKPQWVAFRAHLTVSQARALKAFCDSEGIELKAMKGE